MSAPATIVRAPCNTLRRPCVTRMPMAPPMVLRLTDSDMARRRSALSLSSGPSAHPVRRPAPVGGNRQKARGQISDLRRTHSVTFGDRGGPAVRHHDAPVRRRRGTKPYLAPYGGSVRDHRPLGDSARQTLTDFCAHLPLALTRAFAISICLRMTARWQRLRVFLPHAGARIRL